MIKKSVKITAALICAALAFAPASQAAYAGAGDWYCIRSGHDIPPCPPEFPYLEEHTGYYVDRAACDGDKRIYLTFDAGYENGNVEKVLDVLSDHKVKGTFFILENLIAHDPDLVKRMCGEGHVVANHTATHRDMTAISRGEFESELRRLEDAYRDLTGREIAPFYRPPEGRLSEESVEYAEDMGYSTVMWSFAYADWANDAQPDPAEAVEKILSNTHNGMVILLHPTSATNAAILGDLIETWKSEGYRFCTVDELRGA